MTTYTLGNESKLKKLELLKTVTLRKPSRQVGTIMGGIAELSQKCSVELEKLRRLAPDVSGKPPTDNPVGDAISSVAKELGEEEMLSREGDFNLRFLFLQVRATRMVAAMAKAIADIDPNSQRVKWLIRLSSEYESVRNDLIAAVEK